MYFGTLIGTADSRLSLVSFGIWGKRVSFGPDSSISHSSLSSMFLWEALLKQCECQNGERHEALPFRKAQCTFRPTF